MNRFSETELATFAYGCAMLGMNHMFLNNLKWCNSGEIIALQWSNIWGEDEKETNMEITKRVLWWFPVKS